MERRANFRDKSNRRKDSGVKLETCSPTRWPSSEMRCKSSPRLMEN